MGIRKLPQEICGDRRHVTQSLPDKPPYRRGPRTPPPPQHDRRGHRRIARVLLRTRILRKVQTEDRNDAHRIPEFRGNAPMRDYLSSVNLQKNRFFKKCRLGDLKNAFVLLLFEVI